MCVLLLFSAKLYYLCPAFDDWSDARVAEEARLESVYTSKAYPEFESRSLRPRRGTTTIVAPFFLCRNWAEEAKQGASSRKFSLIAIPIASEKVLLNPCKKEGRKC